VTREHVGTSVHFQCPGSLDEFILNLGVERPFDLIFKPTKYVMKVNMVVHYDQWRWVVVEPEDSLEFGSVSHRGNGKSHQ
jgi:hypothetical protein